MCPETVLPADELKPVTWAVSQQLDQCLAQRLQKLGETSDKFSYRKLKYCIQVGSAHSKFVLFNKPTVLILPFNDQAST